MQVQSRFSIVTVTLPLVVSMSLFLLGIWLGLKTDESNLAGSSSEYLIGPALVICFGAIIWFIIILSPLKTIVIDSNSIVIRSIISEKIIIKKADLTFIDLFGRTGEGLFWISAKRALNCTTFILKDGKPVFVADRYYKNIVEIKQALVANFGELTLHVRPHNIKTANALPAIATAQPEKFSGNALFAFSNIYLLPLLASVVFLNYKHVITQPVLILLFNACMLILLLLASGFRLYYFIISGNQLIIKNHCWWWYSRIYMLPLISSAVIENFQQGPNTLHLTFNDYTVKNFQAASLRSATWRRLLERLKAAEIEIKHESFWLMEIKN
ncbi:MAG TPA: hypothetical protein VG738_01815 [Chitinophagaceae bacterium]|nr:hypothetical protein [Chitinophagaceae bacterium]